jgi:acetyltransferase-like isoleucine patch superfamily enzyme
MVFEWFEKPRPPILDAVRASLMDQREELRRLQNRHVSAGDLLFDRWETASFYGFGKGTSCYNNVLIIGDVEVGENSWIGPNVVLDGSGGLRIGSYVSISAGCQIYSHHTVKWSTSLGKDEIDRATTRVGDGVYIGPNSIVEMGVSIGDQSVIGAMSFVNRDIPPGSRAFGIPAQPL